ncbi:DegT/DnrJ/EryC1/StrS family aminotransferase [Paenibacillus qinlingensis]|uniref:Perosamine synthetase n=1 Tax=Paenibacillus qinlingensis TaxID=1837343 RepID=A0ABU1P227_9BACL|nr:DegT/DnrJ/EryC1/StrS family aminotransferase [Paenibacillus qinlingensis]MDR6553594.1 perosamine synthetase [Paenibacillus qinlingensis]
MQIPIYQPSLRGNEKKYVNECLENTWISSKGEFIGKFEKGFAAYIGVNYASAVSNGTVALHAALLALGIGSGDEVLVPTLTYIASVNAISYTGAKPVFVDSEYTTWQMDVDQLESQITSRTKAIMVVHLYGQPVDMDKVMLISKKYNLYIIEDCAEAIGSMYKGKYVGSFGDISTFSFYGNKTITTGEGGMVVSNNECLIKEVNRFKGQGLSESREYWHDLIGYNYRMTNICAAIGLAQLEKIDEILQEKKHLAETYKDKLIGLPVTFHQETGDVRHSYWMCSILVRESVQRDSLRKFLLDSGIETRPLFYPIHNMPMYKELGTVTNYPVAEDISSRGINLPSWQNLSNKQIDYIVSKIRDFHLNL